MGELAGCGLSACHANVGPGRYDRRHGDAEVPQELLDRLTNAEDAVQRFEFIHMVKVDACTAGLGILYAGQKRLQEEVSGFRAETAAEFGSLRSEVESVKSKLTTIESSLAEVLRRLPEPGSS